MALLDLVDKFIGDLLVGNLYTNQTIYVNSIARGKRVKVPSDAYSGIPNVDPRLLNFTSEKQHPHSKQSGPDSTKHVIHKSDAASLHGSRSESSVSSLASFHLSVEKQQQALKNDTPAPPGPARAPHISPQGSGLNGWKGTGDDYTVRNRPRDEIYAHSDAPPSQPPPSVFDQQGITSGKVLNPSLNLTPSELATLFTKEKSFDDIVRARHYKQTGRNRQVNSNIGGTSVSRESVGDIRAKGGIPPTPPLTYAGSEDAPPRAQLVGTPEETGGRGGIISQNLYSGDGGFDVNKFSPLTSGPVPFHVGRSSDVFAAANWLRNVGNELFGIIGEVGFQVGAPPNAFKGLDFLSTQFLLASLNPGGIGVSALGIGSEESNYGPTNAIWNPLAIPTSAFARVVGTGVGDIAPITAGPLFGGSYERSIAEKLVAQQDVLTKRGMKPVPSSLVSDLPGLTPQSSLLDKMTDGIPGGSRVLNNLITPDERPIGPLDAQFVGEKPEENGDSTGISKSLISEGGIYMPFMFQDLRDATDSFLYFRAFLKDGLSENFTPDWQLERYYGRVDHVPIYVGTTRTINLGFDMVAWSPRDLKVMYKKMQKLQSMVYPLYDSQGFMKQGPIIRMRIGDLIAGEGNKGLPGYITAMDFSYDDGIWNIETDLKAPRKISVTISYTVLHDGNPGLYQYESAEINGNGTLDSETTVNNGEHIFGTGRFSTGDNAKTKIQVSTEEIRKIFKSVRNK